MVSYFIIPSIIQIAKSKKIYHHSRKVQAKMIPALGGISMFIGILFAMFFWLPNLIEDDFKGILAALLIIFLMGIKNDIIPSTPLKKGLGQLIVAGILVFKSDIKIHSLFGLLGIYEISEMTSICLSMLSILFIVNTFLLLDGIKGLSASISVLLMTGFGAWFYTLEQMNFVILAFATAGATLALFKYNITRTKILMGSTGKLILGLICAIFTIKFINFHYLFPHHAYAFSLTPALILGLFLLPWIHTFRMFVYRIKSKSSALPSNHTPLHHSSKVESI